MHDEETIDYITNLLTDFVEVENLSRIKAEGGFSEVGDQVPPALLLDYHRYLGDLMLFRLGLFPESFTYGRHTVSPSFYAAQGRRSYHIVANLDTSRAKGVFHNLSDHFEDCVGGLNWVKRYIHDPFYQYVFREFGVT